LILIVQSRISGNLLSSFIIGRGRRRKGGGMDSNSTRTRAPRRVMEACQEAVDLLGGLGFDTTLIEDPKRNRTGTGIAQY